jgi:ribokinase
VVEVVDATGAGDAFIGALDVALGNGQSIAQAVRLGAAAGALATTKVGAQPSLPWLEDVDYLLAQNP